jgi:hypothetical protein
MLVPGPTPVTNPVVELTLATLVLLLLHVPPVVPELITKAVVDVPHTAYVPEITAAALTVMTCVPEQPEP